MSKKLIVLLLVPCALSPPLPIPHTPSPINCESLVHNKGLQVFHFRRLIIHLISA